MDNKVILSAILTRWSKPIVGALITQNINRLPALANVEAKLHASGWVSNSWRLSNEITPFAEPIIQAIITPAINKALAGVDDEAIPALAYGVVDTGIANGKVELFEGRVTIEAEDLQNLRRLLERNLPKHKQETYKVKEDE